MSNTVSHNDFLTPPTLASTVTLSLRNSSRASSSPEGQSLLTQLDKLQLALLNTITLNLHARDHSQILALKQATDHCQEVMVKFWEEMNGYKQEGSRRGHIEESWKATNWASCEGAELARFEDEVRVSVERIDGLLAGTAASTWQAENSGCVSKSEKPVQSFERGPEGADQDIQERLARLKIYTLRDDSEANPASFVRSIRRGEFSSN
ncbi:hypothetical protein V8E51_009795 [Hyaloscypha variabilis]|jgi:hypothetical protein